VRTVLVGDQFGDQFASFRHSAFRLELQPVYEVTYEHDTVARFIAGNPEPPTTVPDLRAWYEQIKVHVGAGRTVERVRVFDEPPTDYQRWEAFAERWNAEAGERIHTITRSQARLAGLLQAAGNNDFWLFDHSRLMVMSFNEEGRRIHTELTDEEAAVQQARSLRDLAVRTARKVAA
jgi:uncharacterized protein DUF6879